jgi:uncharacterized protein (DUF2132 family)
MSNDPLHGKTLKAILEQLVEHYGWNELGKRININCFIKDPSINSSLVFLRKTPWAREKVERLYIKISGGKRSTRDEYTPLNLDI